MSMHGKSKDGGHANGHHKSKSKEQKCLEEFKARVADLDNPEYDDHYLTKWLKARCFDVNKSEKMLRESMAYRKKMRADHLIEEFTPPPVIRDYLTGGFCSYDKEGSPVRVEPYGCLDMKGLMCSCKKSDLEKAKLMQNEATMRDLKKQTEKLGRRVDGICVIFDMQHSGSKQLWRPGVAMYLHLVKILEDNYPELLKILFVVNAPRIFPLLWKVGRPLISDDMKKKIHVLGSDFKQVLLKYIDEDSIPMYLGGTLTDPDGNPKCNTLICHGGEVPRSYYLSEATYGDDTETVTVARGEKLKIDFDVDNPGSVLRWEFRTVDYDIAFGVVYIRDGKEEEIVHCKRMNSHQVGQDGTVVCEEAGKYMAIFDNHYSWAKAKTLQYLVELHTCDEMTFQDVDDLSTGGSWTRLVKGMQITHL